jgi:hypothetical protein
MGFTAALYEGDSVIHSMPVIASIKARMQQAGTATAMRAANEETVLESADLGTAEIKGWTFLLKAIGSAFTSAADWLERKARDAHYRQIEGYLAQSTDHADLERRLRDLERNNHFTFG